MRSASFAIVLFLVGAALPAEADKPYASAGVTELGGLAALQFSSESFTPEGADESIDRSVTAIALQPLIGYFVAPRVSLFAGPTLGWAKDSPDEGDDTTITTVGLMGGAGYYVPAGTVFLGPRAQVGFSHASIDSGPLEFSANAWTFQGAGALRVPFGFGGLLDVSALLTYVTSSSSVEAIGAETDIDTSGFSFGVALGFFVFF